MRAWTLPIMVLLLAIATSGCGQKGPLYRDNQDISARAAAEASDEDNRD
ncbi:MULTISPECIES: lipoprotein [Marinobacter]|uniref:Lipoprotein n=1 Tax=Marinobacter metalliresistant TaxID=2961995 RepID=A0ABZ2VZ22_9GAMM|nr:lipoprotein [Marinobacter sp. Arc7-DN-1]